MGHLTVLATDKSLASQINGGNRITNGVEATYRELELVRFVLYVIDYSVLLRVTHLHLI